MFETLESNAQKFEGQLNSFKNLNVGSSLETPIPIEAGGMQRRIKQSQYNSKLDNSLNGETSYFYNPYQIPPNWKLAEIHKRATQVGKPKKQFESFKNSEVCPCCGFQLYKRQINMMDNYMLLSFLGSGYPLFFSFAKYCIYILATILLTSGFYNLWTNYQGNYCATKKQIKLGLPYACTADYISTLTLINKANNEKAIAMQNILNLITTLILIILCIFYRSEQKQIDYDVDAEEITPADYTIMVKGIPQDMTENQLKEYMVDFRREGEEDRDPLVVVDICYVYNVKNVKNVEDQIHKLVEQKKAALKNIDEDSEEFRVLTNEWDDKIYYQLLQSISYLRCVKDDKTQFTGYAFVSFDLEDDKQYVLQSTDQTLWEAIYDYFFSLSPEFKEIKLKQTNQILEITESPEPLDIIWENLTMKDSEKSGIRQTTRYATIAIIAVCAYIIYLLNKYQNDNSDNEDSNNSDLSFTNQILQQFSFNNLITSAAIIVINNFVITLSFTYFVHIECYNTRTVYNVSLAKRLTIALFVNSALVITFISFFVTKNVYQKGGLVYTTFYYFVIDIFLSFISSLIDEDYYVYLIKKWWYSRQGKKSRITQKEAHEIYQLPNHQIELCYAELMNNMCICVFFAPAIPIGLVFQLIGIFFYYWLTKYFLIRYKRMDCQISTALSLQMTNFLEMLIPTYSISCALFEYSAYGQISIIQIVTIVISVLFSAVPVQVILEYIIEFDVQVEDVNYMKAIHQFTSTYKRENPFTSFERRHFSRKYKDESFIQLDS
ncbi:transmembrane protein, putative (macronuclear) [Tetrahymena thermophila SB210]|uniref:Transmembrane protein, putative n=1 Tax=Tetrahymena thermophila (strain SB210) TaxID=312017 RepID=I7M0V7_TETTS|nr:transmembrane protein, putative [Tetrahymena thermophila SB210]EAR91024.2 transmembrane protein, putative [Tetrahymena thermophila SB210]|eukprot:XP_001011269.2 transmembrane protein, putative [Tetrahymena thermophila SB210]